LPIVKQTQLEVFALAHFDGSEKDEFMRQLDRLDAMANTFPDTDQDLGPEAPEITAKYAQMAAQAERCLSLLERFEEAMSAPANTEPGATWGHVRERLLLTAWANRPSQRRVVR
jgi:hypothetical protein